VLPSSRSLTDPRDRAHTDLTMIQVTDYCYSVNHSKSASVVVTYFSFIQQSENSV
jgi:hypothetical protein